MPRFLRDAALGPDAGPGEPLDASTRRSMEQRFARDLRGVRVHKDTEAAAAARAVHARAFTVGRDIVFAAGRYAPGTDAGRNLLAHELAHVVQQTDSGPGPAPGRQHEREAAAVAERVAVGERAPAFTPAAIGLQLEEEPGAQPDAEPPARPDIIFIMGDVRRDRFYQLAARYFRAHVPGARMVTDQRTLEGILSWIGTNVAEPIGNLYIVSHANEDGTLSFGLNPDDLARRGRRPQGTTGDSRLSRGELRDALHPPGGGESTLPGLDNQVDAETTIHIRGCNIGQNEEMLNLVDEAFGGAGRVTAPTHEQVYGTDPTLGRRAGGAARREESAARPLPPPVDPALRGRERGAALRERQRALRERTRAIDQRVRTATEVGQTYEAFSGPALERPGTELFTRDEIAAELAARYSHLSERQQSTLVTELLRAQRVQRRSYTVFRQRTRMTARQARAEFAGSFRENRFRLDPRTPVQIGASEEGNVLTVTYEFRGRNVEDAGESTFTGTVTFEIPSDEEAFAQVHSGFPNPDDYEWRVGRADRDGVTTVTVTGERVRAYLHHRSLDVTAHEHFTRPESDTDFYGSSTFTP